MDTCEESKKLSSSQLRKIKKPLIEKRRRERINDSLSQLKSLILEALNKDENQYNKMEKADILELTVKHLKNLMGQQKRPTSKYTNSSPNQNHDAPVQNNSEAHIQNYKAGFVHCVTEVQQYMQKASTVQQNMKNHLTNHLNARLHDMPKADRAESPPPSKVNGYVQILPKDSVVLRNDDLMSSPISPQGIQCVQSLPILNGQTFVLANPAQGLNSPTYQQMIQLAQPIVTYIQQQQLSNNNNLNIKNDELKKLEQDSPELMVEQSTAPSSCHQNRVPTMQYNREIACHALSDVSQQSGKAELCRSLTNRSETAINVPASSQSNLSSTSVSNQNHSNAFHNRNSLTTPKRDYNLNEKLAQENVRADRYAAHQNVLQVNDNSTLHLASRCSPDHIVQNSGFTDSMMWRPW